MRIKMLTAVAGLNYSVMPNEEVDWPSDTEAQTFIDRGMAVKVVFTKLEHAIDPRKRTTELAVVSREVTTAQPPSNIEEEPDADEEADPDADPEADSEEDQDDNSTVESTADEHRIEPDDHSQAPPEKTPKTQLPPPKPGSRKASRGRR